MIPLISDRLYILNGGSILTEGSLREVFSSSKLMKEACLEPPTIAQVFSLLQEVDGGDHRQPLPLTVEEAIYMLRQRISRST